jgi:hypothetical protein
MFDKAPVEGTRSHLEIPTLERIRAVYFAQSLWPGRDERVIDRTFLRLVRVPTAASTRLAAFTGRSVSWAKIPLS